MYNNYCDDKNNTFWLDDVSSLFCSLSPVPQGDLTSAQRLNAITRLILYIYLLMLVKRYRYKNHFIILSLIFVFFMHKMSKDKKTTENYSFLSFPNNNMNFSTVSENIRAKKSQVTLDKGPELQTYTNQNISKTSYIDSDGSSLPSDVMQERMNYDTSRTLSPIYSSNVTNNYRGSSDRVMKANNRNFEAGERDDNAGIQYYSIKQGVNRKTMIEPIIAPPSHSHEYWGKSSYNIDNINRRNYTDLTEDELFRTSQSPYSLGAETHYESRVRGAVEIMNDQNDQSHDGLYDNSSFLSGGYGKRDYDRNVLSTYDVDRAKYKNDIKIYEPTNVLKVEADDYPNHLNSGHPYKKKIKIIISIH